MKLQLDYDNLTISLENSVNLKEFYEKIKNVLPDWKDWTLNTNNVIQGWSNPIIIERPYTPYPWWEYQPQITFGTGTGELNEGSYSTANMGNSYMNIIGTYNVEI